MKLIARAFAGAAAGGGAGFLIFGNGIAGVLCAALGAAFAIGNP